MRNVKVMAGTLQSLVRKESELMKVVIHLRPCLTAVENRLASGSMKAGNGSVDGGSGGAEVYLGGNEGCR